MDIKELWPWLGENWELVLGIYGLVVTVASAVVKWTPNATDNKILDWALNFFNWLGLNNGTRTDVAKGKGEAE